MVAGSEEDMVLVAEGMEDRRGRRSLLEEEENKKGNEDDEDEKGRQRGLSLTDATATATATATPAMDDGRRGLIIKGARDRPEESMSWMDRCLFREGPTHR